MSEKITETITLSFDSAEQQQRFHERLAGSDARMVAGRSIAEWREFARHDDCLDQMVPSDLRAIVNAL